MKRKLLCLLVMALIMGSIFMACGKTEQNADKTIGEPTDSGNGTDGSLTTGADHPETSETLTGVTDTSTETDDYVLTQDPREMTDGVLRATYLGVVGYGSVQAAQVQEEGAAVYRFQVDDTELLLSVKKTADYRIQNCLMEGFLYELTLENRVIVEAKCISKVTGSTPVLSAESSEHTIKNLIANAFAPMGTTLYVYGGGWNWQDDGFSTQVNSYGLSPVWEWFYKNNGENYVFRDKEHPEKTTYPYGGWNEYYYAGLDCSGYMTWVVYNSLASEEMTAKGLGFKSTEYAKKLAERGYGTWSHKSLGTDASGLRPGDIVSMSGHVWMCLGTCEDGSAVILHSVNSPNKYGEEAGGVSMSALSPKGDNDTSCEAYKLIVSYAEKYYPEWYEYNPVMVRSFERYTNFAKSDDAGWFRWTISESVMQDPDGYYEMSAGELLEDLFQGR